MLLAACAAAQDQPEVQTHANVPQQLSTPGISGAASGGPIADQPQQNSGAQPPAAAPQTLPQPPAQQPPADSAAQPQPAEQQATPMPMPSPAGGDTLPAPEAAPPPAANRATGKARAPARRKRVKTGSSTKSKQAALPQKPAEKKYWKTEEYIPPATARGVFSGSFDGVKTGAVEGFVHFAGTTTASDFADMLAPFDGRLYEFKTKLFQWVEQGQDLGVITSVEMAAQLDIGASTATVRRRWGSVFDYEHIKAPYSGIVVKMNVKDRQDLHENDPILTIGRKFYVIGRTNTKVPIPLQPGMPAIVADPDGLKGRGVLDRFVPVGDTGLYQVRVEVTTGDKSYQPGMVFTGEIQNPANPRYAKVPVNTLIRREGKTYMLILAKVKPGGRLGNYAEILDGVEPGMIYIDPSSLYNIKPEGASCPCPARKIGGKS